MHGLSFDKRPCFRFGFHRCLYIQGCFATGGAITVAAFYKFFLASGLSVSGICHYIEEQGERSIGRLVVAVAITVEQF